MIEESEEYILWYSPSEKPKLVVNSAVSMKALKELAKLDSRLHGRPPELYSYLHLKKGQIFTREEVREVDAANLRAVGTSV
jgi:hypothetical protein